MSSSYRRPTTTNPAEFWHVSQELCDIFLAAAAGAESKERRNCMNNLRKYNAAGRIMETVEGIDSSTPCKPCLKHNLTCRVFGQRGDIACAYCKRMGKAGCSAGLKSDPMDLDPPTTTTSATATTADEDDDDDDEEEEEEEEEAAAAAAPTGEQRLARIITKQGRIIIDLGHKVDYLIGRVAAHEMHITELNEQADFASQVFERLLGAASVTMRRVWAQWGFLELPEPRAPRPSVAEAAEAAAAAAALEAMGR